MNTNCELYKRHEAILAGLDSKHHSKEPTRRPLNCKVWFIADTHFFHQNVIEYCARPFKSVEEMNETLVNNWNSVVSNKDKVFMVGDFALGNKKKIIEIGQRLNGRKTLILGNHDNEGKQVYYNAGFEYISRHPIIFQGSFIVSHDPQFIQENGLYVNIFGHVHDNPIYTSSSKRSFCVSVERINYTPVEFNTILKKIVEENECINN